MYEWGFSWKRKPKVELYGLISKLLLFNLDAKLQEQFLIGVRPKGLICVMFAAETSDANDIYIVGIDCIFKITPHN